MLKKLILCGLLTTFIYPLYAQGPLVKAGSAVPKAALEQSIKKAALDAVYQATLADMTQTAVGASHTPFSAYDYSAGAQPSFNPSGTLGYFTEYPTADLAAFYKRVYYKLSQNLSSRDITQNQAYAPELRKGYQSFVGELQELNAKMAQAVHDFLGGRRDTYLMEQVDRLSRSLTPRMAQFKAQFPQAQALQMMEGNMKYYSAAVMRMPFFDEKITPAFAYHKEVFNLSPTADTLREEDFLAIDDFYLPEQFRLAVVHDDQKVFNFFRTAQQKGALPPSWQVDVFENADDFMQAHRRQPYPLVISDRGLDNTFDKLILTLRHRNDLTPVIAHTAGLSYDPVILYDKGYSAVFPLILERPMELTLVLKKYFYYAGQGLLPPITYTSPARKITYP